MSFRLRSAAKKGQGRGRFVPAAGANMRTFSDPVWAFLLGPQTVPGTYSATGVTNMEGSLTDRMSEFVTNCTSLAGFVAGSGTITVTNGSSTMTGSGTNFLSRVGRTIRWVDVTAPKGYGYAVIVSAASDTSCTIGGFDYVSGSNQSALYDGTTCSGVACAYRNTNVDGSGVPVHEFHMVYNYYDTVFALYQAWAKDDNMAGGSTILSNARTIADALVDTEALGGLVLPHSGIDQSPRQAALLGLMCRAKDGGFNKWFDTMDNWLVDNGDVWLGWEQVGGSRESLDYIYSVREGAYCLMFAAALAVCHYNGTRRTYWRDKAVEWAIDPCTRKFNTSELGGLRWWNRQEGAGTMTLSDGTTPANYHQPFLHALMMEAFVWTHRMMRYHGLTADPDYTTIGNHIVAGADGWWSCYQSSDNGQPAALEAAAYFTGLSGYKAWGTTSLTVVTPPGSPFALLQSGGGSPTWDDIVSARQLNADFIGNLGYAALLGGSGYQTKCHRLIQSCFQYQASSPSTYSSLWYSGQTQKNWNQHHRACQKATGWLTGGLETF